MTRLICVLLAVTVLLLPGCSDRSKKAPKIRKREGIATKIDLKNNIVAMTWKDPNGVEWPLEGTLRENTEVRINGRDQKVEDVKIGDKVIVYGFKEGKGENEKLVATMIEVTRAGELDWKTASQPATTPGKNPAPTPTP